MVIQHWPNKLSQPTTGGRPCYNRAPLGSAWLGPSLSMGMCCTTFRFLLLSILFVCFTSHGGQNGWVLVIGLTNGVPITQVGTNDYYRDKLFRDVDRTLEVELASPRDWRRTYDGFSDALVNEAKLAGLEAGSLEKLLKRLLRAKENKGLAVVPVAVHQTQDGGEPIWIITLRWEEKGRRSLSHFRKFWFNRTTLKQLDFFTCG